MASRQNVWGTLVSTVPANRVTAALAVSAVGALSRFAVGVASAALTRLWGSWHTAIEVPLTPELEQEVAAHVHPAHTVVMMKSRGGKLAHTKLRAGQQMRLRGLGFSGLVKVDAAGTTLVLLVATKAAQDAAQRWLEPFVKRPVELQCTVTGVPRQLERLLPATFKAALERVPIKFSQLLPGMDMEITLPSGVKTTLTVVTLGQGSAESGSTLAACTLRIRAHPHQDVTCDQLQAELHALAISGKMATSTFVSQSFGSDRWTPMDMVPRRPLRTLALPSALLDDLLADIGLFLRSRDFYLQRGCMFKRAFLLYGPPGTGKTSLVGALIAHFGLRMRLVSTLSNSETDFFGLGDDDVLVFDEVDKLLPPALVRAGISDEGALLHILDGAPGRRQLVFLTTNNPEKLPRAVLRPGRCDRQVYLGAVDAQCAEAMYAVFFPDEPSEAAKEFGDAVIAQFGDVVMPCAVQEHLIRHRGQPCEARTDFTHLAAIVASTAAADLRDALPKPEVATIYVPVSVPGPACDAASDKGGITSFTVTGGP